MLASKSDGKIETKVPGFDLITGGGLLKSSALLFMGDSDGRKELLVRQICLNLLEEGAKVLYYTVDHSAEELRYDMASYRWDIKPFEDSGKLKLVDMFSDATGRIAAHVHQGLDEKKIMSRAFQEGLYDLSIIAKEGIRFMPPTALFQSTPRIVVIDSISPLLSTKPEEVLSLLHSFKLATRVAKTIGIGIVHRGVHENRVEETLKALADGIIEVTRSGDPPSESSLIEVIRYIGEYRRGPFPIEVESTGIKIIPISLPNLFRTDRLT